MVQKTEPIRRKKGGKGTHGSLTKAGKVRGQTPKIPKSVIHVKRGPRLNKRRSYYKRFELHRKCGQNSIEERRR
jgi:small subunit ribosomal protein S30e